MKHCIRSIRAGVLCALAILALADLGDPLTAAEQNVSITYQGRVTSGGNAFSGAGQFKFALVTGSNVNQRATATANLSGPFVVSYNVTFGGSGYLIAPAVTINGGGGAGATAHAVISGGVVTSVQPDAAGSGYTSAPTMTIVPPPPNISFTTFWSNDETSVAGSEPAAAVSVPVSTGLFTVVLGDTTLPNMAALDVSVFSQPKLLLRIWFNDGVNGFAALNPPQELTPAPYAHYAANLSGTVTAGQIVGTISSNNIAAGSIGATMLAAGAIGSNQLAAGAVTTAALAPGAVTADKVATVSNWFPLTIPNPTPMPNESFGQAVAALGSDRMIIGAPRDFGDSVNGGAAYLFSISGLLLATFNNPASEGGEQFGAAVAAMGNDRVLIGEPQADIGFTLGGLAHLFNTNGALVTTFTNPTPMDATQFGLAVAAVGSERVLIGAPSSNIGASNAGAAYLFSTNGALLHTFANPTPAVGDFFGYTVAVLGSDRVLIGAPLDDTGATDAGVVYLFSTNGSLLATFTKPVPATQDVLGTSIAVVGSDRVLIGAYGDSTGAINAGAAYLFSTNGALVTTFTNPTPAVSDFFGYNLAALGSDRVLIGAPEDDTGATDAGAVYLFSMNGALLATFNNPNPAFADRFGLAVAAVGSNRVLVGTPQDDATEDNAGSAYLFSNETFANGLIASAMLPGTVTSASLQDGAVTISKLDPTIGIWNRSGGNVFRTNGNVGIGTATPRAPLSFGSTPAASKLLILDNGLGNDAGLGFLDSQFRFFLPSGGNRFAFLSGSGGEMFTIEGNTGNIGIGTNSPKATLHVNGNIRMGPSGYNAVGGTESLRIVRGTVSSTGSLLEGQGFTVSRTSTGVYQITFSPAFPSLTPPSVTANAQITAPRVVTIPSVTTSGAGIRIFFMDLNPADVQFSFIAVGVR